MDQRKFDLANWARHQLMEMLAEPGIELVLQNLSGDASFRRYFRAELPDRQFVLVDAPPDRENSHPFVAIAASFRQAGLLTPTVHRVDYALGFMLLEDFGDALYLPALQAAGTDRAASDRLYLPALDALVRLQKHHATSSLPAYSRELLRREMQLFDDWFCRRYLDLSLDSRATKLIADCFTCLEDAALAQVQVSVHRDYHSRNLMLPKHIMPAQPPGPAVLDFQDAVSGPYTYDLVSLLRDCYIEWPLDYVLKLARYYRQQAEAEKIIPPTDEKQFFTQFDLMGLQRNLKVIGIFARLSLRDGKSQYLADIPLVIRYFLDVAQHHAALAEFVDWFRRVVLPPALAKLPGRNA